MFQLDGVETFAKELDSHSGWDPRFGVWKPKLRRVSDELVQESPSSFAEIDTFSVRPIPQIKVLWRGSASIGDSLGNCSAESLKALTQLGVDYQFSSLSEVNGQTSGKFDLEIQIPGVKEGQSDRSVRYLFHEFGHFYNFPIREQDLLWAPSKWIHKKLKTSFPKNQILLVPHGVDLQCFHAQVKSHPELTGEKFRFLYLGTTTSRKGIDLLLQAFEAESRFMPQAELLLKISPTSSGFIWKKIYEQGKQVRVWDQAMTPLELARVIRSCQVLVSPSRAEAFCLPVLEAMACGIPAIVTRGSAMEEFSNPESCFSIESEEVRIPIPGKEMSFLEPNLDSLRALLRKSYENRERLRSMGNVAAESAKRFSWEKVTRMLLIKAWDNYQR